MQLNYPDAVHALDLVSNGGVTHYLLQVINSSQVFLTHQKQKESAVSQETLDLLNLAILLVM
jgi:hypothetical protein